MISAMVRSLTSPLAWLTALFLTLALLAGCGGSSSDEVFGDPIEDDDQDDDADNDNDDDDNDSGDDDDDSGNDDDDSGDDDPGDDDPVAEAVIRLNQVGFLPQGTKLAVVTGGDSDSFEVVDADSGESVHSGTLGEAAEWAPADESVRLADFSDLTQAGEYRLEVGESQSHDFAIDADAYGELNKAALKAYYYNRASTELLEEHAGDYAREAGHPDDNVLIHASAAHGSRSAGDPISAPKGWYDAGDFGKYVVNSGISVYTLLAAYEHFPDYYDGRDVNIPESGDEVPDLLDEVRWNLDWMLEMQDEDGGVYHKLTTLGFAGTIMPADATADRYVIGKGTSATLNFAATMAMASRIWEDIDSDLAADMLAAAEDAWAWAEDNPNVSFENPDAEDEDSAYDDNNDIDYDNSVSTGEYGGNNLDSNFAWAAAELYITTGESQYWTAFDEQGIANWVPGWTDSRGLAWMSLAHHRENLGEEADVDAIESRVTGLADTLAGDHESSAYAVAMGTGDFYWGSNSNALNRAMMLLQGYRIDEQARYKEAAQSLLDYILGRNPTGYSYVTGHGDKTPMNIHHRVSEADDIEEPVPGFVVGGPNVDAPGDCDLNYPVDITGSPGSYQTDPIAKAYLDDWCSYSTNEVTINWNAPLVYVSGALQALAE